MNLSQIKRHEDNVTTQRALMQQSMDIVADSEQPMMARIVAASNGGRAYQSLAASLLFLARAEQAVAGLTQQSDQGDMQAALLQFEQTITQVAGIAAPGTPIGMPAPTGPTLTSG